jgi:Transposase
LPPGIACLGTWPKTGTHPPFPPRAAPAGLPLYKWRAKYGGMDASLMGRMKELEEENRRLKKLYVEAQIKADIVAEALAKKL